MVETLKTLTNKAQSIQSRAVAILKVLGVMVATAKGVEMAVHSFIFSNWEHIAPIASSSPFAMYAVAAAACGAVFIASTWACLTSGLIVKAVEAAHSEVKEEGKEG